MRTEEMKAVVTLAPRTDDQQKAPVWLTRSDEQRAEHALGPLAHVGIIRSDLTRSADGEVGRYMRNALIALGIEPLFFKDIGIVDGMLVHTPGAYYRGNQWYSLRRGATLIHDNAWRNWVRRPLVEYINDGNPIPNRAVAVLERLQEARLPIGCSIMVWTPDQNMNQQQELPDPLLVLELSNGSCFALCRWNG